MMATQAQEIPESMRVLGVGQTPFMTEQGFLRYMGLETAGEPERGWMGLNAALEFYSQSGSTGRSNGGGDGGGNGNGGGQNGGGGRGMGMENWWKKLGPIPRECFPAECPAEIQTAVDVGQAKHRALCQDAIEGSRAYHALAQQGQRNAIELVSDGRYVRVDQWGNRIY